MGDLEPHHLRRCDVEELADEWKKLRKERETLMNEFQNKSHLIQQLKEEVKKTDEEKDRMIKEKDKSVQIFCHSFVTFQAKKLYFCNAQLQFLFITTLRSVVF